MAAATVVGATAQPGAGDGDDERFAARIADEMTRTRTALNAASVANVPTVATMLVGNYPVGGVVQTHGYHTSGDGGACRYVVIPAKAKSYDLAGTRRAFRPTVNGTIHLRQFGTINDGITLDNRALQACFDYAEDFNVGFIDGQGLSYTVGTVNPYDILHRGWSHTGAYMTSGRTLRNANFKTAAGSTSGTVAFTVKLKNDKRATYITNVTLDGNKDALGTIADGREDGGCHLVHLWHPMVDKTISTPANRDFYPCGDVIFTDVEFTRAHGYGVRVDYLDCTIEYVNCKANMTSIVAQFHSTRTKVRGFDLTLGTPRPTKGGNPFHVEIEFGGRYSGDKKLNVDIEGVTYRNSHAGVGPFALYKVNTAPCQDLEWETIRIANSTGKGRAASLFEIYTPTRYQLSLKTLCRIGTLRIEDSTCAHRQAVRFAGDPLKKLHVDRLLMHDKPSSVGLNFVRATAGVIDLTGAAFSAMGRIWSNGYSIERLIIKDATAVALDEFGIIRDQNLTVRSLEVSDSEFTQRFVVFECIMPRARFRGVTIHPTIPGGMHQRVVYPRGGATDLKMTDMVLTGTQDPKASNARQVVFSDTITTGMVYLNDVRHLTRSTTTVRLQKLGESRKVLVNVAPIIAA